MVFSKTNKKRSIKQQGLFYETKADGKFLCSRHLHSAKLHYRKSNTNALMPTLKPLFHFCIIFMKKKHCVIQFSWHT